MKPVTVVMFLATVLLAGCNRDAGDDGAAAFCAVVDRYVAAVDAADVSTNITGGMGDSAVRAEQQRVDRAVRSAFSDLAAAVTDLERRAPDDVAPDIEQAMVADRRYLQALEQADYDLFATLGDPRLEVSDDELAAANRVEEYTQLECRNSLVPIATTNQGPGIPEESPPVAPPVTGSTPPVGPPAPTQIPARPSAPAGPAD